MGTAARLCIAASVALALLAQSQMCILASNSSIGGRQKPVYDCTGWPQHASDRNDSLTFWVPLAAAAAAGAAKSTTTMMSAQGDHPKLKSLNASLCAGDALEVIATRTGAAIDEAYYVIKLDRGGSNATTAWLFWSFSGTSDCSFLTQNVVRLPGFLMVIAEAGGFHLLVENIVGDRPDGWQKFLVEVGGESFNYTQFTKGASWFTLSLPSINLRNRNFYVEFKTDLLRDGSYYEANFDKMQRESRISPIANVKLQPVCSGGGYTREKPSLDGDGRKHHTMLLIVCLCVAMALVIGIGLAIFNRRPITRIRNQNQHLHVALAGGADFLRGGRAAALRRRLSADAAARPVAFDVADLAGLRARSDQFDLVLLFLGPDDARQLTPEQSILLGLERWRFRTLLLATGAPAEVAAAAAAGVAGPEEAALLQRVEGGVGVVVRGIGEDDRQQGVADMFEMAREACREAVLQRLGAGGAPVN